jgi:transcriptional regulator of nitric oxide reductase
LQTNTSGVSSSIPSRLNEYHIAQRGARPAGSNHRRERTSGSAAFGGRTAGVLVALLLLVWPPPFGFSQGVADPKLQAQLKRLFPDAASFTPKGGSPPHFKALGRTRGSGPDVVIGYAFWTTELEPLERGYDGPIKILVGLSPQSVLTGIVVAEHREPYGDFSIDPPEFSAQFAGKSIRDPFRIGSDIDAVSRATISVGSASRAVRNSARRVAKQLLAASGGH